MFTGLVEALGEIVKTKMHDGLLRASVRVRGKAKWDLTLGESIAVDGCCLTLAETVSDELYFDISRETLERTTLARLKAGDLVNLERAMRLGDRLGGHMVTGHVDGVAVIEAVDKQADGWQVKVRIPGELARYVIAKGSICLSGVSLTINSLEDTQTSSLIGLTLIPTTLQETTFSRLKKGDTLNVEVDMVGKYIERFRLFADSRA